MTIQDQINLDLHQAMLNKDKELLTFLRVVASDFYLKGKVIDDEMAKKVLRTLKEEATIMNNQYEIDVIAKYLPALLSEAEIKALVIEAIKANGFAGMKDMGKVMAELKKLPTASQIDNTYASKLTKELLA
jgi:hypothetical protein